MTQKGVELKKKRATGGGRKPGSGRYQEPTKVVRVPESLVGRIHLLLEMPDQLEVLIDDWLSRYEGTVRGATAKRCSEDLKEVLETFCNRHV